MWGNQYWIENSDLQGGLISFICEEFQSIGVVCNFFLVSNEVSKFQIEIICSKCIDGCDIIYLQQLYLFWGKYNNNMGVIN